MHRLVCLVGSRRGRWLRAVTLSFIFYHVSLLELIKEFNFEALLLLLLGQGYEYRVENMERGLFVINRN